LINPGVAAPPPDLSFDVSDADFEHTVLERSMQVPVLLDCWAPWCGPCRSLGPVLEKLVKSYGGSFVLAKLNTDEAPQISAALQMRSIPLVVLFIGGRPVDQFVGALPEGQIRAFLDKHIQGDVIDAEVQQVFGPLDEAAELMQAGDLAGAQELLDAMPAEQQDAEHARLTTRLQALQKLASAPTSTPALSWRTCTQQRANGQRLLKTCWMSCCATRPSTASVHASSWWNGLRCVATRMWSAAGGGIWGCI
jgi:thioredoxin